MSIEAKAAIARERGLADEAKVVRLAIQLREEQERGQVVRAAWSDTIRERRELERYLWAAVAGLAGLAAWVTWLLLNGAPCLPASS